MTKFFLILIILILAYVMIVRPWVLRRGATDLEIKTRLSGDGLVVKPNWQYTQAVTIHAPRDIVWGFVVQMGYQRAGWYNLDFINKLADKDYFYEGQRSAQRIIPELQNLEEGDSIYLTPQLGMEVEKLQPAETLMLTGRENERYLVVWTYQLQEIDPNTTRLLVRWCSNQGESFFMRLFIYILEPGASLQQALNLKGIKERSEVFDH